MRLHLPLLSLVACLLGCSTATARTPSAADAVGAPAFWAAGFTGGSGPADTRPVVLLIHHDTVRDDHPAFSSLSFRAPPGATSLCDPAATACQHGTELAGIVASTSPDQEGVAPGLATLLADGDMGDYSAPGYDGRTWAIGLDQQGADGLLPGSQPPAEVLTASDMLSYTGASDGSYEQQADRLATSTVEAYATGNAGPATGTTTCAAYDVLCVGAIDAGSLTDPSDDAVASYSSRGPTGDGREKPDLVALGNVTTARADWQTAGTWWINEQGTSFAAPQVAGGAALLIGSGIADPLAVRAILIDSARAGRATPSSPMGTQTGWQPDWGWGELDLAQALAERTHAQTASVAPGVPRFFAATPGAGDRATLVWNRRVDSVVHPLTSLSLIERDRDSCAVRGSSTSAVDNVEQTRSPATDSALYEVRANSAVDGLPAEPFALSTTAPLTSLTTPVPRLAVGTAGDGGPDATVTVTASNPSPEMGGGPLQLTLRPSSGLTVVDGPNPVLTRSFPPGGEVSATWSVRALEPGAHPFSVDAQTSVCSEPLLAGATGDVVTSAPPRAAPTPPVPVPSAPAPTPIAPARISAHLHLASPSFSRARMLARLSGTITSQAHGHVTLTLRLRVHRHLVRLTRIASIRRGRFDVSVRLPTHAWSSASVTALFAGDARVLPATVGRRAHHT